jgi:peptidoglycan lytic transglycosylase
VSRLQAAACAGLAVSLALACAPLFSGCATPAPVGQARIGGTAPYQINGKTYVPLADWLGFEEVGLASWYGAAHDGKKTASGELFDADGGRTAAHKTLPFNVCAEVENLRNGKSVLVRINDRGPFTPGRVIDLSRAAASKIGLVSVGVARVRVEAVGVADLNGQCRKS